MALEFKKLSDVNVIETMKDGLNVLVEDGGEIVRVPAEKVGGGSGDGAYDYIIECDHGEEYNSIGLPAWDALDKFGNIDGLYELLCEKLSAGEMPRILFKVTYRNGEANAYYVPTMIQYEQLEENDYTIFIYVLGYESDGFTMRRVGINRNGFEGIADMEINPNS